MKHNNQRWQFCIYVINHLILCCRIDTSLKSLIFEDIMKKILAIFAVITVKDDGLALSEHLQALKFGNMYVLEGLHKRSLLNPYILLMHTVGSLWQDQWPIYYKRWPRNSKEWWAHLAKFTWKEDTKTERWLMSALVRVKMTNWHSLGLDKTQQNVSACL